MRLRWRLGWKQTPLLTRLRRLSYWVSLPLIGSSASACLAAARVFTHQISSPRQRSVLPLLFLLWRTGEMWITPMHGLSSPVSLFSLLLFLSKKPSCHQGLLTGHSHLSRRYVFTRAGKAYIGFWNLIWTFSLCAQSVAEEIAILPEQDLKWTKKSNSEPAESEVLLPAIKVPKFDTRSPSQTVFKPQWLGVGFGATGVRARGVQSRGRGPSSPLSTCRPVTDENKNENKVVINKQKQRGKMLFFMYWLAYLFY